MKILLIHPLNPQDIEFKVAAAVSYLGIKSLFAPHALATIAALTPREHEIKIHDEAISGQIESSTVINEKWDIVGVHLTTNQVGRCAQIAKYFEVNHPNTYRIAGGIGSAMISKDKTHSFQSIFHGEAEESWIDFLTDFQNKNPKPLYRRLSHPEMTMVPIPRWELIAENVKYYGTLPIQTTRGCPFDCSFCNVIYTYGRKMRCKSVEQVIEEVTLLNKLGVKTIFFADDNFAGNRKYTKEILRELTVLNNSFDIPLTYMTQLDITIAKDEELLELLADCNFVELMIGIEAIDPDTLKEMNKVQNLKDDIVESVKKIQSYGLTVFAHMIAGFDNDTPTVFDRTEAFFKETGITEYLLHPLMAPPGTKLWYQFKKESRVINTENLNSDTTDIIPNIIPKRMSRIELMEGIIQFWGNINKPESNLLRAKTFISNIKRIPEVKKPGFKGMKKMRHLIIGAFSYFLFKADKKDRKAFFELLQVMRKKSPSLINRVMFLYTNYLLNRYRIELYSEVMKAQIDAEKSDPSIIQALEPTTPIPDKIIEHSQEIFETTFHILRKSIETKDKIYNATIEAITDFSNKFGGEFQQLDDFQRKNLEECTVRVINIGNWKNEHYSEEKDTPLVGDKPPVGFFGELFNSLDSNIRYKKHIF